MAVLTKEQIQERGKVREETVPILSLGPDAEMTIKGFTVADQALIAGSSVTYDSQGRRHVNEGEDRILSVLACVSDPPLTIFDREVVEALDIAVVNEILTHANRLSRRTVTAYQELLDTMRTNHLLRRLYTVCVEKLGRMPSELGEISEEEFMTYLAAAEAQGEADEEAIGKQD